MTDTEGLPRLYTIDELTEYLGQKSDRHIRRSVSGWPHLVVARQVRFTEEHVRQILALHERGTKGEGAPAFSGQKTRSGRSG